jgi:hypothetical protein
MKLQPYQSPFQESISLQESLNWNKIAISARKYSRSRSLEQWAAARETSEEIAGVIWALADHFDDPETQADSIWSNGEFQGKDIVSKVVQLAFSISDDDVLFWGNDKFSRFQETRSLQESLSPADRKVIDAFYDKKPADSKLLWTDGKKLDKMGLGGQTIAVWKGYDVKITATSDVKSTDSILNYIKKTFPKKIVIWEGTKVQSKPLSEGDKMLTIDVHANYLMDVAGILEDIVDSSRIPGVFFSMEYANRNRLVIWHPAGKKDLVISKILNPMWKELGRRFPSKDPKMIAA